MKKTGGIIIVLTALIVTVAAFPQGPLPDGLAGFDNTTQNRIDEAVKEAVLKQCSGYFPGEFSAEGHEVPQVQNQIVK